MLRRTGDDVHAQVPLGPIERRTIILEPGTAAERQAVTRSGNLNIGPTEADIHTPEKTPKFSEISAVLAETALAKAPQVGAYTVRAAREEPVVFFAHHKPLLHSVSKQLETAGIKHDIIDGEIAPADRAKAVQRFQEGRTQAILLSLGTGKEGFTLTRSRRAIFGDLSWRPTDLLQAEKRVHRIGQKGDVLIEYLVLDDSLDAMQADVMARKMASIAGGVGVSESAAEFGGVDNPDDPGYQPPPVSKDTLDSRADFCETAPAHRPQPTDCPQVGQPRFAERRSQTQTRRRRRRHSGPHPAGDAPRPGRNRTRCHQRQGQARPAHGRRRRRQHGTAG